MRIWSLRLCCILHLGPSATCFRVTTSAHGVADAPLPRFCRFDILTLIPLDKSLIDLELLSAGEVAWIDAFAAGWIPINFAQLSPNQTRSGEEILRSVDAF